jgi:uncharacterized protein (TIGR03000 family)
LENCNFAQVLLKGERAMTKRWFAGAAVLGLAASVMLLFPAESQAQRRGGWGGGWGRGVGVGVGPGGVSVGVGNGFYGPGYGYGYGGYPYGYGGYGYGYGYPYSYGFGRSYYGYSSPYYYGSTYDTYTTPSYASAPPTYAPDYQSFYPPQGTAAMAGTSAMLLVQVPDPNAQVFLEGQQMNQQGTTRQFSSPPLQANREYTYTVKARWMENGQQREQTQEVDVRAGQQATVRFGGTATDVAPAPLPNRDLNRGVRDINKEKRELNRDINRENRELNRDINKENRELNRDLKKNATNPNPDKLPPPPPADRIDK